VGKSSIFNALLQSERAIVTPIPGTTRDYLEEAIALDGYLIRIFDTAGLRSTEDTVEQIGISRSYDIIRQSHLVLFITEDLQWQHAYDELKRVVNADVIVGVANKADTMDETTKAQFREDSFVLCSATQAGGLDALKALLRERVAISDEELSGGILNNSRQRAAVNRAIASLQKAQESTEAELGYEFTAFDLQEASGALEEVIGHVSTDDILHQIFENFCIGK
jgi:tRNA modification GTPase